MKLVLGLDSLLGGPLCPLFVISPGRMLGQVENGATTRIYVAVSSIVICTSHAAFYDCTLHEWIFLECLLYCNLCDKCGHFDIFYRKFHFLLISHKTHISNKFLSISYLIYYLMYHIYYFNVKIQKIYKIHRKWIKKIKTVLLINK